jgi:hypothetical protein
MSSFSTLLFLLFVAAASAFSPIAVPARANMCLAALPENAYLRGGKQSWIFEQETMYVEVPKKANPAKKVVVKAAAKPAKKVAPKKKSPFGF